MKGIIPLDKSVTGRPVQANIRMLEWNWAAIIFHRLDLTKRDNYPKLEIEEIILLEDWVTIETVLANNIAC